jgi:hypothetical protein
MPTLFRFASARRGAFTGLALAFFSAPWAGAITITVDYSLDSTGFFASNTAARNAVNAAASDISAAILPSLGAVPTDVFTGTSGSTTATLNWSLSFRNPVTDTTVTLNTFAFTADNITIYAGMRPLSGSTLGQGGPGGAGVQAGVSGQTNEFQAAFNVASANSDTVMKREAGGLSGPIIGTLSGGNTDFSYTVKYAPIVGQMSFDNDADNNGSPDADLSTYWNFDHTNNSFAGKNDFYSVALHELLHSIGLGASESWNGLHAGTTWNGANAKALNGGSGLNLVSSGGDHIADSFMDPSLTTGSRKFLTQMDMAFLRDLGYATVPEPSTVMLLGLGGLALLKRRRAVEKKH